MKNNLILALDTTGNSISVALIGPDKVIAHQYETMERGQGEALIPMIEKVVKKAGRDFKDLTKVAVAVGPGSFTGVRIGLATARGIGLALNIPVVGVTSFDVAALETTGKVLVVLDTKRGDFFTQIFQDGEPVEDPIIRNEEQIRKLNPPAVIGSGVSYLTKGKFKALQMKYEPAVAVGLCSFKKGRAPDPLYLRDADVSI